MITEPLVSITAADMRWEYFRGTGAGGQKRNKTSNCVRCTHEPSGVIAEARDSRSQRENREVAFRKVATDPKFQTWLRIQCAKKTGAEAELRDKVEQQLKQARVEVKDDAGRWVEWTSDAE